MDKLEQVRRLLADGYTVEDIDSDHASVVARLRRGGRSVTIRFHPSEAERILYSPGLRLPRF